MSVFAPRTLFKRIMRGEIVRGLSERELEAPEGAGFDLSLNFASRIVGDAFLGVHSRHTGNSTPIDSEIIDGEEWYTLNPGDYVLLTTRETVDLEPDIVGFLWPRTTMFRSGAVLSTGVIAPGYRGPLTVGCYMAGSNSFRVARGARILHMVIAGLHGPGLPYRGQWQDGRVSTATPERQT